MSNQIETFYKIFAAWQDDREEEWLREMAQQGWHLIQPKIGRYTFRRGEPQDIVYRLDYNSMWNKVEQRAYYDLFEQAGWELVAELVGWQYFRKPAREGEADEIYTDNQSKIAKHTRLMVLFGILTVSLAFQLLNMSQMPSLSPLNRALIITPLGLALALNGYALLRTYLRVRELQTSI